MRVTQATMTQIMSGRQGTGGGDRLPAAVSERLEYSFGADLSAVRIHVGLAADGMARALGADAFTCGPDIFFRDGRYRPWTRDGVRLLAHEIAHVVQQARGDAVAGPDWTVGTPFDRWEREADRSAEMVLAGRAVPGRVRGTAVVPPDGRSRLIQCHSDFEHRVLGDVITQSLCEISAQVAGWKDLVRHQLGLLEYWRDNPLGPSEEKIHEGWPNIRTLRIGPDKLLVTYGELNALPDYLPNAAETDALRKDILVPVLQTIRQDSYNKLKELADGGVSKQRFSEAVYEPASWPVDAVNTVLDAQAMDLFTFGQGIEGRDHYAGALARNACHFAPSSWYRWKEAAEVARNWAKRYFQNHDESARKMAWVYNGFADHFLQDSFASGHLINKTLVMQWFVEWAVSDWQYVGDWENIKGMTTARQPFLSGKWLYDPRFPGPSNDPQDAQDAATIVGRFLASSVVADWSNDQFQAYGKYLAFITNVAAQLASNNLHDYYCGKSVWVASPARPQPYLVWGDLTLLSGANGADGVRATSVAAQLSQQSIEDLLRTGSTRSGIEQIQQHLPTMAGDTKDTVRTLESWATDEAQKVACHKQFASITSRLKRLSAQLASPQLGIVSQDQRFTDVWHSDMDKADYGPVDIAQAFGRLFTATNGWVYELDRVTGKTKNRLLAIPSALTMRIACDSQRLYVGGRGVVLAVSLSDWSIAWPARPVGQAQSTREVAVLLVNGSLFAGSDGWLCELSPFTGDVVNNRVLRVRPALPAAAAEVRLAADHGHLYAGMGSAVYAVAHKDWGKAAWTSPALAPTDRNVDVLTVSGRLFAGCHRWVYELDPATDRAAGFEVTDAFPGNSDVRLCADRTHLFAGSNGHVAGVPLGQFKDSTAVWRAGVPVGFGNDMYGKVDVLVNDGRLYAGTNGCAFELRADDGFVRQRQALTYAISQFPVTLATDGDDLYAGVHGYAYKVRARDVALTGSVAHNWFDGRWNSWDLDFKDAHPARAIAMVRCVSSLDAFAVGADGVMYYNWFNGIWGKWKTLFTESVKDIVGVASGDTTHAFIVTSNETLWYMWRWDNGTWNGPTPKIDPASGAPLMTSVSLAKREHLELFGTGTDGTVWHTWYDGNWHGWERNFDGARPMQKVIPLRGPSNLDVFGIGVDGTLWHDWYDGSWHGWEANFDGADPGVRIRGVAGVLGPSHLEVFTVDVHGILRHNWFDGSWHGWEANFDHAPQRIRTVTCAMGPSHVEVFAIDIDGTLWHDWYDGSWHGWTANFDGSRKVIAVAARMGMSNLEVFTIADA
ncbi:MAG TPA: DUF4157 domain-containing protein [Streptosporangiaceae bacterium]|nr:DUF4157 domain-containing protein [Streptosporangiaceae bacterium]